ncbi:hypothetical protein [Coxiella-like endosymbiont]|uniref:hypothetical protein n=1 Tax=Coxiella-like endosymbiont TaxID=1592897 RepID=UPI0034E1BB16
MDVNTTDWHLDRFSQGNTPLHYALEAGNQQAIYLFLINGARLDIKNKKNESPLDHLKANEFLLNLLIQTWVIVLSFISN